MGKKRGVRTHHDYEGRPVFRDRLGSERRSTGRQRRAEDKLEGMNQFEGRNARLRSTARVGREPLIAEVGGKQRSKRDSQRFRRDYSDIGGLNAARIHPVTDLGIIVPTGF